jgi:uncharacterized protein (TIGR02996 family)
MVDDEELIADITGLLDELAAEGALELVTRRSADALASRLLPLLQRKADTNVGEWLVEQPDVGELYLDEAALASRFRRIVHRMEHGDEEPKSNAELEAIIEAAPEDVQARLVYADWLQQEGDPRGELIAVESQLQDKPDDPALLQHQRALLNRHRAHFYGPLTAEQEGYEATFRFGFFDTLQVDAGDLERLLSHPSNAASFAHLEALDLRDNGIDSAVTDKFEVLGVRVQGGPSEDRYDDVDE